MEFRRVAVRSVCVNTVEHSPGGAGGDLVQERSCAELAPPPALCSNTSEGPPPGCGSAPFALFAALAELRVRSCTVSIVSADDHSLSSTAVRIVAGQTTDIGTFDRSEERREGKECRSRWSPYH